MPFPDDPPDFVKAIRALADFRYISQAPVLDDNDIAKISDALKEFHDNKAIIISSGARRGAESKQPLEHWQIPKLELMQSVAPSVSQAGSPLQWSADTTEHAHVIVIKDPVESTNNASHDPQICRYLDRAEKCRLFEIAVSIAGAKQQAPDVQPTSDDDTGADQDDFMEPMESHPAAILNDLWSSGRSVTDFFKKAEHLEETGNLSAPWPPRTFITTSGSTAIHLNYDPSHCRMPIDEVSTMFHLPDLRGALADYFSREGMYGRHVHTLDHPRRATADSRLHFDDLQVWFKVRIQQKSFHDVAVICPTHTINASPPGGDWTFGHYDAAIFNVEESKYWPQNGLDGHIVTEVRLIMRPVPPKGTHPAWSSRFLVYVQRLDLELQSRRGLMVDPITGMHILKRATRSPNALMGDILPLDQLRAFTHIIPRFGEVANPRLNCFNSSHFAKSFYLNKYFDKEFYYTLSATM
ncbi:hypothetical protein BU15DRAFT_71197 [Melanogaster broomeanus]|nr:hypothetical protein BU15DRAFT_71197 [Melanogaster broomeanus]